MRVHANSEEKSVIWQDFTWLRMGEKLHKTNREKELAIPLINCKKQLSASLFPVVSTLGKFCTAKLWSESSLDVDSKLCTKTSPLNK